MSSGLGTRTKTRTPGSPQYVVMGAIHFDNNACILNACFYDRAIVTNKLSIVLINLKLIFYPLPRIIFKKSFPLRDLRTPTQNRTRMKNSFQKLSSPLFAFNRKHSIHLHNFLFTSAIFLLSAMHAFILPFSIAAYCQTEPGTCECFVSRR